MVLHSGCFETLIPAGGSIIILLPSSVFELKSWRMAKSYDSSCIAITLILLFCLRSWNLSSSYEKMVNKTVIVSGASGNLGTAVVNFYLDRGDQVIGLVHRSGGQPRNIANYVECAVNLLDELAVEECVKQLLEKFGKIDIAVMTAGGFAMGDLSDTGISELEHQYRLNFETAYNLTKPLYEHMKLNHGGRLFFVGSGQGLDTSKGKHVVAYSLSKSLLFQLTNIINADTAHTGIRAHVVVPSIIDTPQNRESMPDADFSKWEKPADIAAIIAKYADNHQSDKQTIVVKDELK